MDAQNDSSAGLDFAIQVRMERLAILWKVTVIIAGLIVLFATSLGFPTFHSIVTVQFIVAGLFVLGACGLTHLFLKRNQYERAVWVFTLGLMAAISVFMLAAASPDPAPEERRLAAFALPVVVLMVGLLMPVRATMLVMGIATAITVIMPVIGAPFLITGPQVFTIVLILLAAGIAAQTSGEVYGIAEWALNSYNKERQVKEQLFDSQEALQRSYLRQKVLADELQQANIELEAARAAALEAKNFRGQFLANMSHELRTPLNAIIGFSETMLNFPMMYDNQELPPAYKMDMTQIFNSGKHLLQIINDILDLSKVDAGRLEMEIEAVDLDPIFKGVLSTAIGLVGDKPIQVRRQTAEGLPQVRGDSLRIRQVILNLLSNAAKFTDQGEITVGASYDGGGEVIIWVRDTGIGIPPEDMDKIFEEFRQGASGRRKGRAGSGLGLAISRQLLSLMGGRIWAESTLNEGSTFYFSLPVYALEPVQEQRG